MKTQYSASTSFTISEGSLCSRNSQKSPSVKFSVPFLVCSKKLESEEIEMEDDVLSNTSLEGGTEAKWKEIEVKDCEY